MNPLHGFPEWVAAVFEHWHGWVSGGVVAFALELKDRLQLKKWEIKPKVFALFVALGLFWSVFAAWRDEHNNTEKVIEEKSIAWSQYNTCAGDLKQKNAEVAGWSGRFSDQLPHIAGLQQTVNSLQGTLAQQQAAVTTCVGDLAKAILPQPHKITFLMRETGTPPTYESEVILLTNKSVSPVNFTFSCDGEIDSVQPIILTEAGEIPYSRPMEVKDKHNLRLEIMSGTWTPITPLVLVVKRTKNFRGQCSISNVSA